MTKLQPFDLTKYEKYTSTEISCIRLGTQSLLGSLRCKRYKKKAIESSQFLRRIMSAGYEGNRK